MYNALIFATPMPKTLRDSANIFGIAHIFAISGFHLSILALVFMESYLCLIVRCKGDFSPIAMSFMA